MGVKEDLLRLLVNIVTSNIHCKGVMSKCGTISRAGNTRPLAGNHRGLALQAMSKKGSLDTGAICRGGGSE